MLNWRQLLLIACFVLALFVTGLFAYRAFHHARHVHVIDEPIKPWMNVLYISHSYRVPPPVLYKAIAVPFPPPDKRPLRVIAEEQHRPVEDLIKDLQNAIAEERKQRPPPSLPPPPGRGNQP